MRSLSFATCLLCAALSPVSAGPVTRPAVVNVYEVKDVPKQRIYIQCGSATEKDILALRDRLIRGGAEKVNLFFMEVIACEVALDVDPQELIGDSRFSYIEESEAGGASVEVARAKTYYETAAAVSESDPAVVPPVDFQDRVFINNPDVVAKSRHRSIVGSPGSTIEQRATDENSEFMIGNILVRLVYPESGGAVNSENWTDQELRDASQGAVSGALAFQTTFAYLTMNFVFTKDERIPTNFEPIRHSSSDDASTWIPDVMANLGYAGPHATEISVHNFNEDGRKRFGTDWVYTAFIANSRNEPGHIFSGSIGGAGYTAYAFLGGPYLVIPFPAGENLTALTEVRLFSQIYQHEMVHCFWGLDEYPEAPSDCGSISGYLAYPNKNKVTRLLTGELAGCPDFVDCLMWAARIEESANRPICRFTAGATGVVDANGDGIPDIFAREPIVEFEGELIDTVESPDITLNMRVRSQAVPNRNPLHDNGIDYAPPLKDATLNVDGVGETRLTPKDGRWDETEEDLTFSVRGLNPGLTRIQLQARSEVGVSSATVEKRIYFLGINFTAFDFDVDRDAIIVKWQTVGETFGAQLDLYRIDTDLGAPDTTRVSWNAQPRNPGEMFQNYDYEDRKVLPGHEYRYYVVGFFEISVGGTVREFKSVLGPFAVRAMLPLAKGESVSYIAPNPFRETTTISIAVPKTFAEKDVDDQPGGTVIRQEVPTRIKVTVYDVKGRRVKDVYVGRLFSQVETFVWDGTNARGMRVPSGVYFVKAEAGSVLEVRKVIVVR